jgi:Listeria-Bacteroides repeat domain (List_Bact_rpt).
MWNCKLRYDANEGTGTLPEGGNEITKYVGDSVTTAGGGDLTRNGNAFDHWNTQQDDSGKKYPSGQSFVIKDNTVLYAVYASGTGSEEPDDTLFTLTYNANGGQGTLPDEKQYSSGETVAVASKGDLARTGCTFKEWNTKPDGSGKGYMGDGSDSFVIDADTKLYAIWVDDSGKTVPAPGTGESSLPLMMAINLVVVSLAAVAVVTVRQRRKRDLFD